MCFDMAPQFDIQGAPSTTLSKTAGAAMPRVDYSNVSLTEILARWQRQTCTRLAGVIVGCLLLTFPVSADGPKDNDPNTVRAVPPKGIVVPQSTKDKLLATADQIDRIVSQSDQASKFKKGLVSVIPRAIRISLETEMFYAEKDIAAATSLLEEGLRRAQALKAGEDLQAILSPKQTDAGVQLAVVGFESKIDGSIQPYGIVLPSQMVLPTNGESPSGSKANARPMRLDVWLHGRGERVSEAAFLSQRLSRVGEYTPDGTIVLHPYGRYSNAFKFAGEVDVLESIDHICKMFSIDRTKITIRGFSMGGAGCWQMAVHYPNLWAAANPGAGFSETQRFLDVFQGETYEPTGYGRDLLHWYDCPDWVNNLRSVPTVAYSGEIDKQKQAADVMAEAFQSVGLKLPHVIGPNTAHKIHPDSKVEIGDFLDDAVGRARPAMAQRVDLTTYTLRYNQLHWLTIVGLQEHWKQARVRGEIDGTTFFMKTSNVTDLEIAIPTREPFTSESVQVSIDGQTLDAAIDDARVVRLTRDSHNAWSIATADRSGLVKRPGLQGPIDDAFMDAFVFVAPNPPSSPSAVDRWVDEELKHATLQWRRHMRGDVRLLRVDQVSPQVQHANHLILFGTPESNPLIAKMIAASPIDWDAGQVKIGSHAVHAERGVAAAIYPNPASPDKYVVINSGFTYREYAYLNNARQIPMLPDWALIDISDGATTQLPGKIVAGGFFGESWQVKDE